MYYITPAIPDASGWRNIVFRENFEGAARDDYRLNPDAWKAVGHIDGVGQLIALNAPDDVFEAFKDLGPLIEDIQISKSELLLDAFMRELQYAHPTRALLRSTHRARPFVAMIHGDSAGFANLTQCQTTNTKPQRTDSGGYMVDLLMFQPDGRTSAPIQVEISRDGQCHISSDGENYCLPAKPLLVTHHPVIKGLSEDQAKAVLNENIGCMWWTASSEEELQASLSKLSLAGAHVYSIDRETDRDVIHYGFALNKDDAAYILGYFPGDEEWLELEDDGVFPSLAESLYLNREDGGDENEQSRPSVPPPSFPF